MLKVCIYICKTKTGFCKTKKGFHKKTRKKKRNGVNIETGGWQSDGKKKRIWRGPFFYALILGLLWM